MSIAKRFIFFCLIGLCLGGCNSRTQQPTPTVVHPEVEIALDPALDWLRQPIFVCAANLNTGIPSITENEAVQNSPIHLVWGETGAGVHPIFQLGEDEVVLIVNANNPTPQLSFASAQAIFKGETADWKGVAPNLTNLGEIHIWNFPSTLHIGEFFMHWLDITPNPAATIHLAPDPAAIRQAVSADPSAIGWLPKRWLDKTVKEVPIPDLTTEKKRVPILVYLDQIPDLEQSAWIKCLQDKITPKP